MTPKSLLRLPAATSRLDELTSGGFQAVIDDSSVANRSSVKRIVLCSGKVYYDLAEARKKLPNAADVPLIRLEQFYPFPARLLEEIASSYPNATELIWCQEEPKNMGGWTFVEPRLENLLPKFGRPRYAGRAASASPATGSYALHQLEQAELIDEALHSA